jgi:hypothetical protein
MPTYTCKTCSSSFVRRTDNRKPIPTYCSTKCFGLGKTNPLVEKTCPRCGKLHTKEGTFCSRACGNSRFQSEETREKKRAAALKNPSGAILNRKPSVRKPERSCLTCHQPVGVAHGTSSRQYCSENCRIVAGNRGGYRENSTRCKRSEYKGFKMHSGSELEFAILLDEHNIRWSKNSTVSFPFLDSTGKSRKYYPDFYLPDLDHWIEIKGRRYLREDDDLRLAAVGNIERIMHDDLRLPTICSK